MNCPQCGAGNRPGAKYCAQCRAPLASVVTLKVCPQCGAQNRMSARFCTGCGYTFTGAAPASTSRGGIRRYAYAAGALCITVLVVAIAGGQILSRLAGSSTPRTPTPSLPTPAPTVGAPPTVPATVLTTAPSPVSVGPATQAPAVQAPDTQAPQAAPGLNRALLATVQVITLMGQNRESVGSGSVLTEKGHILTNFHVIGDVDTGSLYNRDGIIYIAVNSPGLKDPPQVRYIAQMMQNDRGLDLALLKIVADQNGGRLPASLGLTTLPVGDSDTVEIGDALSIIGFPGLGGETVTFTRGSVSGYLTAEGWIKSDAEINSGNSGGAAINGDGLLIGVPSQASAGTSTLPGKIGLVRPINLARPLIDTALADASK